MKTTAAPRLAAAAEARTAGAVCDQTCVDLGAAAAAAIIALEGVVVRISSGTVQAVGAGTRAPQRDARDDVSTGAAANNIKNRNENETEVRFRP